jgi:hypothetical protein
MRTRVSFETVRAAAPSSNLRTHDYKSLHTVGRRAALCIAAVRGYAPEVGLRCAWHACTLIPLDGFGGAQLYQRDT